MKLKYLNLIFSVFFTGILLYFLAKEIGSSDVSLKEIFFNLDIRFLLAYIFLSFSGLFLRAFRYQTLLNTLSSKLDEKVSFFQMFKLTAIRNALVDMFPARLGEASFFYVLKSFGIELTRALSVFTLCLALDLVVLAGIFLFSLFYLFLIGFSDFNITPLSICIFGAVTIFLVVSVYFADFYVDLSLKILKKLDSVNITFLKNLKSRLQQLLENLKKDFSSLRAMGKYSKLFFLTSLLRLAKYLSLYFVLISITQQFNQGISEINPVISSISFILAEATASLPTSGLFGFGAYEGAWSIIMKLGKIDLKAPLLIAFSVHLITQIVGYLTGIIGLVLFATKANKKKGIIGFERGIKQEGEPELSRKIRADF